MVANRSMKKLKPVTSNEKESKPSNPKVTGGVLGLIFCIICLFILRYLKNDVYGDSTKVGQNDRGEWTTIIIENKIAKRLIYAGVLVFFGLIGLCIYYLVTADSDDKE